MDIEALEKLVTLKEKGLITEQEFIAKKEELLSGQLVNDTSEKVGIVGFIKQGTSFLEKGFIPEQEFIAKKEELLSEQVANNTSEKIEIKGYIKQDIPFWKKCLYVLWGIIVLFFIILAALILNG